MSDKAIEQAVMVLWSELGPGHGLSPEDWAETAHEILSRHFGTHIAEVERLNAELEAISTTTPTKEYLEHIEKLKDEYAKGRSVEQSDRRCGTCEWGTKRACSGYDTRDILCSRFPMSLEKHSRDFCGEWSANEVPNE